MTLQGDPLDDDDPLDYPLDDLQDDPLDGFHDDLQNPPG